MRITFLLIAITIVFSCNNYSSKNYFIIEGLVQGTTYRIVYQSPEKNYYRQDIEQILADFDKSLSTYQSNSIISRINNNDTSVIIDDLFKIVFEKSRQIYKSTKGAFDPTVGPLVNAWGFGPENPQEIDSMLVDSLLQFVGMNKINISKNKIYKEKPGIKLDFNAIAQGYSVDLVCDFFENKNIKNYLVEIGGEVKAKGKSSKNRMWRIGVDKPKENLTERELQAIVKLNNKGLATSGNYRKFIEKDGIKYSHTINPKTGFPQKSNLLSVSVIANDCMTADGYATSFMVLGLDKSYNFVLSNPELEAFFIFSDINGNLKVKMTKGFKKLIVK